MDDLPYPQPAMCGDGQDSGAEGVREAVDGMRSARHHAAMEQSTNERAQERLAARFAELGLDNPREAYRKLLLDLKTRDTAAFEGATTHYHARVLPELGGGADPVATWIEYGRFLGELIGQGSMHAIDASGRASPVQSPLAPGALVVWLMDAGTRGSFVAVRPRALSAAQAATIGLLVEARLSI